VLSHAEGVDLVPANIRLASYEAEMAGLMCREHLLKRYLAQHQDRYDYILIDCLPSLGVLAYNALAAADSVIVPVQPEYLASVGMTLLFKSIGNIRNIGLNPNLAIDGVVLTMCPPRTKHSEAVVQGIAKLLGGKVRLFDTTIPANVKVREASAKGRSVYVHAPTSRAAVAYEKFTQEVLG
jgi:chromosome partitioning protein